MVEPGLRIPLIPEQETEAYASIISLLQAEIFHSMKHTAAFGLFASCATALVLFVASTAPRQPETPAVPLQAIATDNSVRADTIPAPVPAHARASTAAAATPIPPTQHASSTPAAPATTEAPTPLAQLTVVASGTSVYSIGAPDGTSLIDAMHLIEKNGFAFTSRDYPGLGAFVDSIQGIKNENGMYWILSINGSKSSLGASSIVLHQGDQIEWRYEKSY